MREARAQATFFAQENQGKPHLDMLYVGVVMQRTLRGSALIFTTALTVVLSVLIQTPSIFAQDRRNEVSFLRGPYNTAYYKRHTKSERYSAGFHFNHGKMHDVMQLTPLSRAAEVDEKFDRESFLYMRETRVGPTMEFFGPY